MDGNIDVTILTDRLPDVEWKCPHCKSVNTMNVAAEEIIEENFKYIEHCPRCGYLHYWELHLSDKFKQKVLDMFGI